ncbi:MAG: hypothetical protein LC777_08435 [Actinobacteria bacterium]|nr:hypothetical protein [Actinomycetota bacterium]
MWLDGAKLSALSKAESLGTTPVGRVQLGDDSTGKTYDVAYDEVVVDVPPANTAKATISGTAKDGETLTADAGTWTGTAPITFAYEWRRCDAVGEGCVAIEGASEKTYALTGADVGATIRVAVTATNAAAAVTASSDPTTIVTPL